MDPVAAAEALGPEADLILSYVDPLGFMSAFGDVGIQPGSRTPRDALEAEGGCTSLEGMVVRQGGDP